MRSLRHFIASPTAQVIVAERAGQFAGSAVVLFRRNSTVASLYSLGVLPEQQGQGLGKRLLVAAEKAARCKQHIHLEVRADNQRAIDLYRAHGYKEFGHHDGYYPDGTDALRLEKHLR